MGLLEEIERRYNFLKSLETKSYICLIMFVSSTFRYDDEYIRNHINYVNCREMKSNDQLAVTSLRKYSMLNFKGRTV